MSSRPENRFSSSNSGNRYNNASRTNVSGPKYSKSDNDQSTSAAVKAEKSTPNKAAEDNRKGNEEVKSENKSPAPKSQKSSNQRTDDGKKKFTGLCRYYSSRHSAKPLFIRL